MWYAFWFNIFLKILLNTAVVTFFFELFNIFDLLKFLFDTFILMILTFAVIKVGETFF